MWTVLKILDKKLDATKKATQLIQINWFNSMLLQYYIINPVLYNIIEHEVFMLLQ